MGTARDLNKLAGQSAAEIARRCELDDAARALLPDHPAAAAYLHALIGQGLERDAIHFLAAALPKREAVWWSCLVVRDIDGADAAEVLRQALASAENWVYQPSEAHRRATEATAEAATFDHAAAWVAIAAFWSGGSLAPAGQPEVAPGPELTGKAVASALLLALAEAKDTERSVRDCLARGMDIAAGGTGRSIPGPHP